MIRSRYLENLKAAVLPHCDSKSWKEACEEWRPDRFDEDEDCATDCVCGKDHIRYIHYIKHKRTGYELGPIGSECIHKFESDEFIRRAKENEDRYNKKRFCEKCGARHRNRKDNFCSTCREILEKCTECLRHAEDLHGGRCPECVSDETEVEALRRTLARIWHDTYRCTHANRSRRHKRVSKCDVCQVVVPPKDLWNRVCLACRTKECLSRGSPRLPVGTTESNCGSLCIGDWTNGEHACANQCGRMCRVLYEYCFNCKEKKECEECDAEFRGRGSRCARCHRCSVCNKRCKPQFSKCWTCNRL